MQLSLIPVAKLAELARTAEKRGYNFVQVRSNNQLALGADPLNPTHVIDLTEEDIRPISGQAAPSDLTTSLANNPPRASRRSGSYHLEIKGDTIECTSLKELLSQGLKALEKHFPGTLDELSKILPRSKRIVSRDPDQLFNRSELVQKYSEKLIDGWWFGTNNSASETRAWLRRGADIAGLTWGEDIRTSID